MMLGKVYVRSGNLKATVARAHYPQTDAEVISVIKEAVDKHPQDTLELGELVLVSRSQDTFFEDDYWISTKSALRKAGFKVQKRR